ncbi:hypothetical protein O6P43_023726 [Quillaja saponaria]|uniref:Uncharacterized protein n=1 Tax=Quillaja saponaria TaxID=32244 RepID=A0AAD7PJ28_QUISA|nr:hypothetical protein O6P43_023726 [Quillaja saponaria]
MSSLWWYRADEVVFVSSLKGIARLDMHGDVRFHLYWFLLLELATESEECHKMIYNKGAACYGLGWSYCLEFRKKQHLNLDISKALYLGEDETEEIAELECQMGLASQAVAKAENEGAEDQEEVVEQDEMTSAVDGLKELLRAKGLRRGADFSKFFDEFILYLNDW